MAFAATGDGAADSPPSTLENVDLAAISLFWPAAGGRQPSDGCQRVHCTGLLLVLVLFLLLMLRLHW
jgi:hypothetical protein